MVSALSLWFLYPRFVPRWAPYAFYFSKNKLTEWSLKCACHSFDLMITKWWLKCDWNPPFSRHSATIQLPFRRLKGQIWLYHLVAQYPSLKKKIISRHLKNILIPSICMFRGIQCHSYFVKHTAFVTLRVRPQWIMTYFYIHSFHFSSVSLFKEGMAPSATWKQRESFNVCLLYDM